MKTKVTLLAAINGLSLDYFDQAPFAFNGTVGTPTIQYLKK